MYFRCVSSAFEVLCSYMLYDFDYYYYIYIYLHSTLQLMFAVGIIFLLRLTALTFTTNLSLTYL